MGVRCHRTGRPAPPPLSGDSPCTPPPARGWSRRHPLGVVGEPAAGRIPSVTSVGGWSRLGASSRPQIRRWDRRRGCMVGIWVSGRPRNPLNASVATFCAAGVISMHQTPLGMVRGVSGVSRGRFVTISTGSHSESATATATAVVQQELAPGSVSLTPSGPPGALGNAAAGGLFGIGWATGVFRAC
jgi:hypothetical protein